MAIQRVHPLPNSLDDFIVPADRVKPGCCQYRLITGHQCRRKAAVEWHGYRFCYQHVDLIKTKVNVPE